MRGSGTDLKHVIGVNGPPTSPSEGFGMWVTAKLIPSGALKWVFSKNSPHDTSLVLGKQNNNKTKYITFFVAGLVLSCPG